MPAPPHATQLTTAPRTSRRQTVLARRAPLKLIADAFGLEPKWSTTYSFLLLSISLPDDDS